MTKLKIGIVGVGHLGSALLLGLIHSGTEKSDIIQCVRAEKVADNAEKFGVRATDDINVAATFADVLFIATKAAAFAELAPSIDRETLRGKTVVSLMAGVTIERIAELIGENAEIVRAMPSLAIETLDGIIGYTRCEREVAEVFETLGYAFEIAPDKLERVTAFSGCGPGFAAYILDAFSAAGQALGFTAAQADIIASRTFAAVSARGGDYRALVEAVATPGGATERGIAALDGADVRGALKRAVEASYDKVK
ncbi:MAG: NAD(P)-binding domain-containing protein [Oscillospiraceae bacterium]|jgi:pyrroline-5-carboxylate reductase|nr:NAD(P)-binding domain-containing protein [Oscillospiraceae bacterium]